MRRKSITEPRLMAAHRSDWFLTIGWGLTAVGWFVMSQQANSRELRKEKRVEVDACCKLVADLLEKARSFYLKEGSDPEAISGSADIRFSMHRLLKRVERLQRQQRAFRIGNSAGQLFESMTGGDFDSPTRSALVLGDERLATIEADCHAVMDALESGFEEAFLPLHSRIWRRSSVWLYRLWLPG